MAPLVQPLGTGRGPRLSDEAGDPPSDAAGPALAVGAGAMDGPKSAPPAQRQAAAHGRHFKRRETDLAEGGKLVLNGDGSISQLGPEGETTHTWATDDPEWARHGIRFGLHPQAATIAPHGRRARDPRPPNG